MVFVLGKKIVISFLSPLQDQNFIKKTRFHMQIILIIIFLAQIILFKE